MIRRNFRTPEYKELKSGLAIWLDGKDFEDTNPIGLGDWKSQSICGPYLIDQIFLETRSSEPRVAIVDPATGRRRSMMCSWLLIPREK